MTIGQARRIANRTGEPTVGVFVDRGWPNQHSRELVVFPDQWTVDMAQRWLAQQDRMPWARQDFDPIELAA